MRRKSLGRPTKKQTKQQEIKQRISNQLSEDTDYDLPIEANRKKHSNQQTLEQKLSLFKKNTQPQTISKPKTPQELFENPIPNTQIYDSAVHPNIAYVLAKGYGVSKADMARLFNLDYQTIDVWLVKYDEFFNAYNSGLDQHNATIVEQQLLTRAIGYDKPDNTTLTQEETIYDENGSIVQKKEKTNTKQAIKHIPANLKAIELFLKNFKPEKWNRDTKKHVHFHGHKHQAELTIDSDRIDSVLSILDQCQAIDGIRTVDQAEEIDNTSDTD